MTMLLWWSLLWWWWCDYEYDNENYDNDDNADDNISLPIAQLDKVAKESWVEMQMLSSSMQPVSNCSDHVSCGDDDIYDDDIYDVYYDGYKII